MNNTVEQQINNFNSRVETYLSKKTSPQRQIYISLLWKLVFSYASMFSSGKQNVCILEPMCGWSAYDLVTKNFPGTIQKYDAFDYSEKMINIGKSLYPDVNFWVQDATTFVPDVAEYDIILLIGGLHHVPKYAPNILDNLSKCLKSDGCMINLEPTFNNHLLSFFCNLIYRKNKNFDHKTERRFSLSELNNYYVSAGLKTVKQLYPGLLAYLLWYNPDIFPFLNKGSIHMVKKLFSFERKIYSSRYAEKMSVATITILKK